MYLVMKKLYDNYKKSMAETEEAELTRNIPAPEDWIPADVFLKALAKLKMPAIPRNQLYEFLMRCGVRTGPNSTIPYKELIKVYQDRSEAGIMHRMLNGTQQKKYSQQNDEEFLDTLSLLENLEKRLLKLLHKDFLDLVTNFRKLDKHKEGVVQPKEALEVLSSVFRITFPEDYFEELKEYIPLDRRGLVRYTELLKHMASLANLFEDIKSDDHHPLDEKKQNNKLPEPAEKKKRKKRSPGTVFRLIKEVVAKRGMEFETAFREIDNRNSGKMTQEELHEVLKRLDLEPAITRGEIRALWPRLITSENSSLLFTELQRLCLHDPKEAAYPNAKLCPPRVGDIDRVPRSKHLNSDLDVVKLGLRSKIDFMFETILHELNAMDTEQTGLVTTEKFREILTELCHKLTDQEMDDIIKVYESKKAGLVDYMAFLRPYLHRRYIPKAGNDLHGLLPKPNFLSKRMLRHVGPGGRNLSDIEAVFSFITCQKRVSS
ncbi:hypothetical protein Ciccas_010556 [Cichlidogyrus casuarinus]|uniref:EF-hand domain-containing protein n=1 Tax=Cichlidogyrus casuarinus TaxID=1844966 RepID=A0ABD2PVU3_9PLAT